MARSSARDMTQGSPTKLILGFFFPLLFGLLFQQLYNMVDTMLVGRFLGVQALAGVGSTGSITFLVMGFCNGICNGFAIPVAQKFGEGDYAGLRRFVVNALMTSAVLSAVKTTLRKNAEETESFSPKDIAEDLYRETPVLQEAFRQKLEETPLPATVSLPVQTAVRVAGKQKIKTDTGIEISVPAELFSDTDCIEFTREINGTTTITIKGIHKISTRS